MVSRGAIFRLGEPNKNFFMLKPQRSLGLCCVYSTGKLAELPIGVNEAKDSQQNAFNFATSPLELSTGIESFIVEPVGTSSVCI